MNKAFCPIVNGWLCPYWDKEGVCLLEGPFLYNCYYALIRDYEEEDEEE